ncbi:hypothetical protein Tco_0159021 [Tanacetum coccineum]
MCRTINTYYNKTVSSYKNEASEYNCDINSGHLYVVSGPWQDQQVVDVLHRTCTFIKWELTSMPCKHVVVANWNMAANNMEVGLPETWCYPCYRLDTWRAAYNHHINPIRGEATKTKTTEGGSNKTKSAQGGSNNKGPADGSSGRNVAAKKTKTINPTQAYQTTQASTTTAMRKNKGKAIA